MSTIIIMAGGTGGHVYPALAVGTALRERGVNVFWMGVENGLEYRIAHSEGFEFDSVRTQGLWGKGVTRWLTMPIWLTASILQCIGIILRRRPDALLGMGGYVCGPGGLASWILRRPLVIHESNAVPGLTNRVLSLLASRVLTGFPNTKLAGKPVCVGNPVRQEIVDVGRARDKSDRSDSHPLHILIIGGSQGAQALNEALPEALRYVFDDSELQNPQVMHQSGEGRSEHTAQAYESCGILAEIHDYIEDMAQAYLWADIIVARAGAMSLAEISTVGLAAVLVPYPHAARDHQRTNAVVYTKDKCAYVCLQTQQLSECLRRKLTNLIQDRKLVREMSERIRKLAQIDSTEQVANHCMEVMQ